MTAKSTRIEAAHENLLIFVSGRYETADGHRVELADALEAARDATRLVRPRDAERLLGARRERAGAPPRIEVTPESTAQALRRLVVDEGCSGVVGLNFASARNPGGGFLRGARAQEEDLACVSALYACQLEAPGYYEANRRQDSMLYTDHMIVSPRVPFFRDEALALLDAPWCASLVTAPAPNAGQARRRGIAQEVIEEALHRRVGYVLAAMAELGARELVLGAWGCGVFQNDPARVAAMFAQWLADPRFVGAFERVTFAILDRRGDTLAAFRDGLR